MTRSLFDPSKVAGPPDCPAAAALTVRQASDLIRAALEDHLPSTFAVRGQVSNLSQRNHWYFSLKDDSAVLSCVAWASSARTFSFEPRDGQEIIANGHVSHYAPQGRTQLYVTSIQPVGEGALHQRFLALCEKLRAAGYFDDARKRPMPAFPRRIAVITSATGAALQDVLATARQRCCATSLLIVDVRVQGDAAAAEIAAAINWVGRHARKLEVDAILVTRGGGSIEDLWAFNEPVVAEAAFKSPLPLTAAIGHESDTTIIELVADLRAATPTQAVMRMIPSAADLKRQVDHHAQRMNLVARRAVEQARARLNGLLRHESFRDPLGAIRPAIDRVKLLWRDLHRAVLRALDRRAHQLDVLAARLYAVAGEQEIIAHRRRLADLRVRLTRAHDHHRTRSRDRLNGLVQRLAAADPLLILQRGFSYTTGPDGRIIRSVRNARAGQRIATHVADGAFESIVQPPNRSTKADRSRRSADGAPARPDQLDLFRLSDRVPDA